MTMRYLIIAPLLFILVACSGSEGGSDVEEGSEGPATPTAHARDEETPEPSPEGAVEGPGYWGPGVQRLPNGNEFTIPEGTAIVLLRYTAHMEPAETTPSAEQGPPPVAYHTVTVLLEGGCRFVLDQRWNENSDLQRLWVHAARGDCAPVAYDLFESLWQAGLWED